MKNIMQQAQNNVNIVGKLLDVATFSGNLSDGRHYERANATIRVTQTYGGKEETSEIPLSFFATQLTSKGTPNPAYKSIQDLKNLKTAQNVGFDDADTIRVTGASLRENAFIAKTSGQLINGWQINGSFVSSSNLMSVASFTTELFIMDIHPEVDREGDPTGRLVVKGGIVQYGGRLDVLDFIVENPTGVDFIERNWNANDTVLVKGRIRVTSVEENHSMNNSWGEDIPETSTRFVRELIITTGSETPYEEEFAYDPTEIKKAFNVRKANIEQLQLDAKKNASDKPAPAASKYSWE